MDGHGNTNADIKRIENRHQTHPPLFWIQCKHCHSHRESDGGVRRWPAPEDATAQKAEVENMTDVLADAVHGMGTARKRFVGDHNQCAEKFSFSDSPTGQNGPGISRNVPGCKQSQGQVEGQQPADDNGRKHPGTKLRTAGGQEITPVEAGHDEDEREQNGDEMPDELPAFEATNEVARQR